MRRLSAALLFPLVLAGCGARQSAPAQGEVRFELEPDTARVYTDERFVGGARVLAQRPARFRTGTRRFSVTADGYFPHDLEVEVVPGTTTVRVSLRPIPQ